MFNESVNTFLERAISLSREPGDDTPSGAVCSPSKRLQRMPKPGEVDILCGGGFSDIVVVFMHDIDLGKRSTMSGILKSALR